MICLSDDELAIVMNAAGLLALDDRSAFLESVAARLSALPADGLGAGSVSCAVRDVLTELHWRPAAVGRAGTSKYR
jgi:hypothetical protein